MENKLNFHPHLHLIVTAGGDDCEGRLLTFVAANPPPPHVAYQEVLMAAEAGGGFAGAKVNLRWLMVRSTAMSQLKHPREDDRLLTKLRGD